jgi:hypothetical protein
VSYEWDIFISYPRKDNAHEWVHNHFAPELEAWLMDESTAADEPRVFLDSRLEPGTSWREELSGVLKRTRLLVPVYSGNYFRSEYCLWELESMLAREQLLGLRTPARPRGLIFPVRYSNGVPQRLEAIQSKDLRDYNVPVRSYRDTTQFVDLVREIQSFARVLLAAIAAAPEWQDGWPIETPPVESSSPMRIPRLARR